MLYIEFDNMLASVCGRVTDAAESHGNLIGLFSAKPQTAIQEWVTALTTDAGVEGADPGGELATAGNAFVAKLTAEDLSFALLLPDDDVDLSARVSALASWCQGYLYGLAQGGIQQFDGLPGDCAEILEDLVELTKARSDDDSESSESDFFELTEYVKVGAQLIFEELVEHAGATASKNLHEH